MGGQLRASYNDTTLDVDIPLGKIVLFKSDKVWHESLKSFFNKRLVTFFLHLQKNREDR